MIGGTSLQERLTHAYKEAKVLVHLRHPNIVQFYGISTRFDSSSIEIMTLLELCKSSAQDWVMDTAIAITTAQKLIFCMGVAQGMGYLHMRMVTHRDLKLANVLLVSIRG
jgi:serine/threonine protein kinase